MDLGWAGIGVLTIVSVCFAGTRCTSRPRDSRDRMYVRNVLKRFIS